MEMLAYFNANNYQIALISEPYVGAFNTVRPIQGLYIYQYTQASKVKACVMVKSEFGTPLGLSHLSTPNLAVIRLQFKQRRLIIASAYIEPDEDALGTFESIQNLLSTSEGVHTVIGMDANAHHPEWGSPESNARGDYLSDFCASNSIVICNQGKTPTFQAVNHGVLRESIVDVTLASERLSTSISDWRVNMDACVSSDHNAVEFTINTDDALQRPAKESTYLFNTKTADWDKFSNALQTSINASELNNFDFENVEREQVNALVDKLTSSVRDACFNSMKIRQTARKFNPFWTPALEHEKKGVIRLHHKLQDAKRRKRPADETNATARDHEKAKNAYAVKLRKASIKNFREFCGSQGKEDAFSLTNRLIKDAPTHTPPSTLKVAGRFTASAQDSGDALINHFFPDTAPDTEERQKDLTKRLKDLSNAPDELPFTPEEVREALATMNANRAPGGDNLTSDICMSVYNQFPHLITGLMNACLRTGVFPDAWKNAVVKILQKPGKEDYSELSSFRPIGLLPIFGKLLEKLIIKRLSYAAYNAGVWSDDQYGFKEQKSTIDALQNIIKNVRNAKDAKRQVIGVSLDIKGAFDNAWWPALMERLRKTKCPRNCHRLIQSYLNARTVTLAYGETTSTKTTTQGCVQGSVCGPTFWNLILDDLLERQLPEGVSIQAYADDVWILVEDATPAGVVQKTNNALAIIHDWGRSFKLTFSASKTQAIAFTPASKNIKISMDAQEIPMEPKLKLLGVVLDAQLNFIHHARYIIKKVTKTFKKLCKFVRPTWGVHSENVEIIYKQVIEPTITYAAAIWGVATERLSVRRELQAFQRKFAIRAIRAFHTVSAVSATALAQFMPLHLKVTEAYKIGQVKLTQAFDQLPDDVPLETRTRPGNLLHPRERLSIQFSHATTQEEANAAASTINIYTDGSKLETGEVGSAFVIIYQDGRQEQRKRRLDQACSVFQAELYALYNALLWIQINANADVTIYSDSRASLMALQDRSNTHPIVSNAHHALKEINQRLNVRFVWVKAHVGIIGNEAADAAAKNAATQKRSKMYAHFPLSYAKLQIRKEMNALWEDEYANAEQGSTTRFFFPTLNAIRRFRESVPTSFETTQILTGHGFHKKYLRRFNITPDDACPCGHGAQDIRHILEHCSHFENARLKYAFPCIKLGVDPYDFTQVVARPELTPHFAVYAKEIVSGLKKFNETST